MTEKTEKLLGEISETLKYQTKLLETMVEFMDAKKVQNLQGKRVMDQIRQRLMKSPFVKGNPKAMELIDRDIVQVNL